MSEHRQNGRRTSARLREKEDVPATNGDFTAQEKKKTTVRQSRAGTNGSATEGKTRSKRKLEYDEEDDGFKFTRAKSKRAKAAAPEPVAEVSQDKGQRHAEPEVKKQQKRRKSSVSPEPNRIQGTAPRRRSKRNSSERMQPEPLEIQIPKRRSKRISTGPAPTFKGQGSDPETGDAASRSNAAFAKSHTPEQRQLASDTTKIALPFADTPIIRRNKEMRKGSNESRRSSLSNRGRRASSLIESGTSIALPHDDVEASDFYKHIESGLLEPRRMRQLLIWCGTRALGEKPSFAIEDGPARLAAREIQQQLLKDFSSKSELSDWLSREEPSSQLQPLRPNPKNIANLAKIEELEGKLKQLQEERKTWTSLLRPPAEPLLPPISDPISSISSVLAQQHDFDALTSLLSQPSPSASKISSSIRERLSSATQTVEDEVDKLVESVNNIGEQLAAAEDTGKKCLAGAARILEERDKRAGNGAEDVMVRDLLRGLSRVAER